MQGDQMVVQKVKRGFTLIELLVVVAIISLLAAILFPVFAKARERARATSCLSNTKQIATALYMYVQDYDEKLPLYVYYRDDAPSSYGKRWCHVLLPYIQNQQVFICPSAQGYNSSVSANPRVFTNTAATGYLTGSYGYNYAYLGGTISVSNSTPVSLAAISSPSETIAIAESTGACGQGLIYTPPNWPSTSVWCGGPNSNYGDQFATWHFEGNNIAFADGHAKWMKKSSVAGPAGCSGTACNVLWDLN